MCCLQVYAAPLTSATDPQGTRLATRDGARQDAGCQAEVSPPEKKDDSPDDEGGEGLPVKDGSIHSMLSGVSLDREQPTAPTVKQHQPRDSLHDKAQPSAQVTAILSEGLASLANTLWNYNLACLLCKLWNWWTHEKLR